MRVNASGVNVGDITINGSTISDGGDFTIDSGGEIALDADGGIIRFKDGGSDIGLFSIGGTDFTIRSLVSDRDIIFKGNDGGSTITALTLDMSDAGSATFNNLIKVGGTTLTGASLTESGDFTVDVGGNISLDADGGNIIFKDGGAQIGAITVSSTDVVLQSTVQDRDLIFKGNDGGATTTLLTLDVSEAGAATFNSTISDADGKIRAIPQSGSDKTSSYTLVVGDVGNFIGIGSGGSITVPNSTFAAGDAISIFNNTTGDRTITLSITTAYLAGEDADKGSLTLATRGICTILFISGTVCVVSGNVS
jgi:hypothetical protein